MPKADEIVVTKFSDLIQECAESVTQILMGSNGSFQYNIFKKWGSYLFGLVFKLGFYSTQFSGSSVVVQLLINNTL